MAENAFWEKYRDRRWQEKRLRIMQRAKFRCEMCGSEDNNAQLHIHHGYYRSKADPWDYPDDTLWCLCESCHDKAEERKHDCHIELARINPAFLELAFHAISWLSEALRLDESGRYSRLEITEPIDGICDRAKNQLREATDALWELGCIVKEGINSIPSCTSKNQF